MSPIYSFPPAYIEAKIPDDDEGDGDGVGWLAVLAAGAWFLS